MEQNTVSYYHFGKWLGINWAVKMTAAFFCALLLARLSTAPLNEILLSLPIIMFLLVYMIFIGCIPAIWIGFVTGWFIESCLRLLSARLNERQAVGVSLSICGSAALLIFWPLIVETWPIQNGRLKGIEDYSVVVLLIIPVLYMMASGIGGYELIRDLHKQKILRQMQPIGIGSLLTSGFLFLSTTVLLAYSFWSNG
ncbi:MAG: hypothetical protein R3A44_39345 [Caldilineaceae bacterium]